MSLLRSTASRLASRVFASTQNSDSRRSMYARAARRTSALSVPTLTLGGAVPASAAASGGRSGLSSADIRDFPFLPRRAPPPILSESNRLVSASSPEGFFRPAAPLFSAFVSWLFAAASPPSSSPRPSPSSGTSRLPCVGSPNLGASRATYLRVASSRTASRDSISSGVGPRRAVPTRACAPGGAVMPAVPTERLTNGRFRFPIWEFHWSANQVCHALKTSRLDCWGDPAVQVCVDISPRDREPGQGSQP